MHPVELAKHQLSNSQKKNAKVVLVARRKEKLLQVEKEISQYADSTLVCQCDVSNKSQVKEMSDTIIDTFGRIDILVNNAGFVIYGKVSELTIEEGKSLEELFITLIEFDDDLVKNVIRETVEKGEYSYKSGVLYKK